MFKDVDFNIHRVHSHFILPVCVEPQAIFIKHLSLDPSYFNNEQHIKQEFSERTDIVDIGSEL